MLHADRAYPDASTQIEYILMLQRRSCSSWGASRVEAPDVCPFCPAVPPSALSLSLPPYSAGQARPRRARGGQRRDVCGASAGAGVHRRARCGRGGWPGAGCGSGRVSGRGTSVKPAAAHVVRAERGRRGLSCTTATRGGSLRLGWVAWSPGLPAEATGLWWGVRGRQRATGLARRHETARRSGRQGRLRYGTGVRARCGAEVQRSRRQGRLLGRLGRPPTWSRHSCGDGFLMRGAKPGGI
jgi:hypothetical protein